MLSLPSEENELGLKQGNERGSVTKTMTAGERVVLYEKDTFLSSIQVEEPRSRRGIKGFPGDDSSSLIHSRLLSSRNKRQEYL